MKENMKLIKQQKGVTGLEMAIIFLAFIILAGVFAYSVLSAGLFTTQKSQEVIDNSLKKAESSVVLKSTVFGKAENTGAQGYLSQITFTLSTTVGGEPVDFTPPLISSNNGKAPAGSPNKVVISYKDSFQEVDDLFWTVTKGGRHNGDNLLDDGEKLQITVGNAVAGQNGGNLVNALALHPLGPDTLFTIEIKTAGGATLAFQRITPSWIDRVINLDTNTGVNLRGAN
jgi:archaeal flagellin FlaB